MREGKCKKCSGELFQDEEGKWFCLNCLADEIDKLDNESEVSGKWSIAEPKTRPITIRINEVDLYKVKKKSMEVKKPYQTFLKEIIHNAITE